MRKVLTDAIFVKAVYRHYRGETLSSIAKDYGIGISTLSEARDRRRSEWDSIREKIIERERRMNRTHISKIADMNNISLRQWCILNNHHNQL